ncbi:hypothetical protein LMJF_04_0920 [Leishmania major strain Friedlin]|uniref:Uncharacterized protein n=1 Tax=Leishmania major TaxID=5664 RepID=O97009_LEIMA|nr:hypothetical protein LMJF_04_0920 [Leishmania major strain Friedlin]CAC22636.1 hypothetical protein LMJF_04_0920 [Leishmania major strain Friedlin]CAG9567797.1 hypothetical_protein_-_conserved [Leishmania major strain Friedlin]|eukprot:XP_888603.1 hypothetical protein LMJF_04_0920 [Leishmania major strain Friedlin]
MEQPPPEQWSSPSPVTMSGGVAPLPQPPLSGFNYRRNPALMMAEVPTPPGTITIQDARAAPTTGLRRPQCGEPHFHTANATSSSPVPPMAIPYIALHNVGWKDSNFKGRKWVIMPMVAGFESTFIANTLQGLLCLPGCESAMMGESAVTSSSDGGSRDGNASALGQDDSRRCGESGVVQQSSRSSSLAEPPPPPQQQQQQQAHEAAADDDDGLEQHSHARSPSPDGADEHSLSSSVTSDPIATEDRAARSSSADGGDAGKGSGARRAETVKSRDAGCSPQALRGGIRSQWGTRVKTAASRTYAAYVMQHLSDANIQLRTPAPHDRLPSDAPVTDTQVDNAEELESLRGQSATVPRCLAPVALPKEPRVAPQVSGGSGAGKARAHVSIFLAHEAKEDEVCTSTCGTTSAAGAEPSEPSVTTTTVAPAAMPPGTASATAIAAVSPPEKAAVLMGLEEGHSSDDNNSPTPSSREEEEEEELWVSTEDTSAGQAGGAAQNAETTRMTNRQVAQDGSRYTCFASNCVDNMPNYPLPQLQSEDLVDLAAFMVVRSSLQPDEATDLHLGTHVLGNPQNVRLLPPEQRAALMSRAARLMEAAVFLQV